MYLILCTLYESFVYYTHMPFDFSDSTLMGIIWEVTRFLIITSFIWLPILMITVFFNTWLLYIRALFIKKQGWVLLELRLPREIAKSPAAMELFFTQLYQSGGVNYMDTYWLGKVRPWFSLEMVSIGGDIHFYIRTQPKFQNIVESQIYAQYPNVEIYEAEDYVRDVTVDSHEMWGTYFKLAAPDPYPILTYTDYGLAQSPEDEEQKIDPISSVIEYLGSLKKGEQAWLQILIQAHKKEGLKEGRVIPKPDWKKAVKDEIEKLKEGSIKKDQNDQLIFTGLQGQEVDTIKALQRSMSKNAFETTIRAFYIAEKNSFKTGNISGLIGSFRQFGSNTLNGFKLGWYTDVNYPWEDFKGVRVRKMKKKMLDGYKMRSFFHPPHKNHRMKPFILTTEELATIFHIPGGVVTTPTFSRIQSRKAEPPTNLPV